MRKHILALLVVSTVLFTSAQALANDVATDMDTIAENYAKALSTKDTAAFISALTHMRTAALDAKKGVPPKLEDEPADSPKMKEYHHGYVVLVSRIDGAIKLAQEGKLEEARTAAADLKTVRNEYHKKFR